MLLSLFLLLWQSLLAQFLSATTQEIAEFHEAALENAVNLQLLLVLSNHRWRHVVYLPICAVSNGTIELLLISANSVGTNTESMKSDSLWTAFIARFL